MDATDDRLNGRPTFDAHLRELLRLCGRIAQQVRESGWVVERGREAGVVVGTNKSAA